MNCSNTAARQKSRNKKVRVPSGPHSNRRISYTGKGLRRFRFAPLSLRLSVGAFWGLGSVATLVNMRTLLFTTAFASAIAAMAQQTAPVAYERVEVVTLDSTKTADQLYTTAKRWFVDAFKDSKAVIELDDAATRTIVGNGSFTYEPTIFNGSATRRGSMRYTLEVSCKDGRYRVKLSNYTHTASAGLGTILSDSTVCSGATGQGYGSPGKPTAYLKRVCKEEAVPMIQDNETKLLASLKAAMLKPAGPSDW